MITQESFANFFHERKDWLEMRVIPSNHNGHDVALVLDGSYLDERDAQDIARYFTNIFNAMLRNEPPTHQEF